MNISVSKEVITTLVSFGVVLAFVLYLSAELDDVRQQLVEIREMLEAGRQESKVSRQNPKANRQELEFLRRDIEELQKDMRELRGIITSHLATHATQGEVTANASE